YGLRPLNQIRGRIASLRAGSATRMGQGWPAEMRPLAGEIDALLTVREADMERARMRAGDLAHGLKTPLQALLGEAGRIRRIGAIDNAVAIEQIADAMRIHVERELARARIAAAAGGARADIAKTFERVRAVLNHTPDGRRIGWKTDLPEGVAVAMDPADLAEALGALAENAVRHARSEVLIAARPEDGRVRITIADDGGGVPEEHLGRIAQRGRRLDER